MKYFLLGYFLILQSCITTFKNSDEQKDSNLTSSSEICYSIQQIGYSRTDFGYVEKELLDPQNYETRDVFKNLEKKINRNVKNKSECKVTYDVALYLSTKPKVDHFFWQIIHAGTLTLIPYWNDYENVFEAKLFNKGVQINKIISKIEYTYYGSIVFLPVMPFRDALFDDFGDFMLDKHIQNISEQLRIQKLN